MVEDPHQRRGAAPLPRPPADGDWRERLDDWRERLVDAVEARPLTRIVAAVATLVLAVGVGAWLLWPSSDPPPLEDALPVLDPAETATPSSAAGVAPPTEGPIVVHVAGAVVSPGLVEVAPDARVAHAIAAAGGATSEADLDRINLAAPLADAARVYVPVVGEVVPDAGGGVDPVEPTGPLDLNTATAEQLEELPGIGPATAAAIIAHRDQHGPFTSVSGLEAVSGIGPAKLSQLRDLVTVTP